MSDLRLWEDDYLRNTQYKDASRLNARLQLHQRFSTIGYDYYRWLFDLMLASFPVKAQILEVGAGNGELWLKNRDRIPQNWHITLTDFAPGILADAQQALGTVENITFQEADVQHLPFADQQFDAVLAHLMLYHIPNLPKAIKEMRRVLTPQGCLHAVTLGKDHMHQLNTLADPFVPEVGLNRRGTDRAFSLENGAAKLRRRFGETQLIRWTDHLHVTEVEPLVDYVLSMTRVVTDEAIAGLRAAFAAEIEKHGKFEVLRDTGLFVARSYPSAKE
jgi:ubiquinone/menaquinone biosynthesis C-methylase UbiE